MQNGTSVISSEQIRSQADTSARIQDYWERKGRSPLAYVETYGCQQNEADSERIRGMLQACGYQIADEAEGADVVVFNTCAVREHAEQRVFGNLGALQHTKRRHPAQKIFVCGCMAGEEKVVSRIRESYRHVDCCFDTHHLWQFPELLERVLGGNRVFAVSGEAGSIAEGIPVVRSSGIRAWVSIMYGCNNFCSYCIVPYVRGRERSRKPEDVVEEVRGLAEAGYREITLLGQNVNSYGKDLGLGVDFADLLDSLAQIPGDFVLRFMTSHPKDASKKLFDTMAKHDKIAKQLHLPFQAGSDRVLREMNRRYTAEGYLRLVDYARSVMPGLVLTSDVIVGFPGETEEEFSQTVDLIRKVRFDALFTFIFSPRTGTPAAKMEDPVSRAEKQVWFDRLLEEQNRISSEIHADYIGKTLRVLIDGTENGLLTARTDGGRLVRLEGDESLVGSFREVVITGSTTWSLTGTLV